MNDRLLRMALIVGGMGCGSRASAPPTGDGTVGTGGASSISVVHVHSNLGDRTVTLPEPLPAPLGQDDAERVRRESGCGCRGELVLAGDAWTASCCEEYADCSIAIDRNTGEVVCVLFG